jgi:DNA-binding NarL/FixJ family response regulator
VYLRPGEAGKKEDHVAKDKAGRKPNPERDAITHQITQLKGEGNSFPQIAEQLKLSLSMVKRYAKPTFDANQGE